MHTKAQLQGEGTYNIHMNHMQWVNRRTTLLLYFWVIYGKFCQVKKIEQKCEIKTQRFIFAIFSMHIEKNALT